MGGQWIVLLSLFVYGTTALHRPDVLLSHCNQTDTLHDYCGPCVPFDDNSVCHCAPDDFNVVCRNSSRFAPEHILPDEWELMLDSHDYQNLIQDTSPAWVIRDVDGDGGQVCSIKSTHSTSYVYSKYSPCSYSLNLTKYISISFLRIIRLCKMWCYSNNFVIFRNACLYKKCYIVPILRMCIILLLFKLFFLWTDLYSGHSEEESVSMI